MGIRSLRQRLGRAFVAVGLTLRERLSTMATLLAVALIASLPAMTAGALPGGPLTIQVQYRDQAHLAGLVAQAGDVSALDPVARTCEVTTSASGMATLLAQGYEVSVIANAAPAIPGCYRTVDQMETELQGW